MATAILGEPDQQRAVDGQAAEVTRAAPPSANCRIVKGNAMKKIIGAAAGFLILLGSAGPVGPALGADNPQWHNGAVSASSWDWPK